MPKWFYQMGFDKENQYGFPHLWGPVPGQARKWSRISRKSGAELQAAPSYLNLSPKKRKSIFSSTFLDVIFQIASQTNPVPNQRAGAIFEHLSSHRLESHGPFLVLVPDLVLVIRSRVAPGRLTGRAVEELAVWCLLCSFSQVL